MRKIAILISGRGSNMASLLRLRDDSEFQGSFALVLSNRPDAKGLEVAEQAGINTVALDHKAFSNRESFDQAMNDVLVSHGIDFVILAGFMRILSPWFVEQWHGRLINIHPSLLPLFRGVDTHQRALEEGVRVHGCTVHFVVPELDAGPIIAQAVVPVLPTDDAEILAQRVLRQEHIIYPAAVKMLCAGDVMLENGKSVYRKQVWRGETALMSPQAV